jgi:very-short-patch-repair endonuclease
VGRNWWNEVMDADLHEVQRAAVAPTARLVEFLRDLVRTGQPTIRDVDHYEHDRGMVRWLQDLRRPLVDIDVDVDARPGEVVFSVDPVVSEPAPVPPEPIARWIDQLQVDDSAGPCPELSPDMPDELWTDENAAFYDRWAAAWGLWAEVDRRVSERRSWFDALAAVGRRLEQQDDVFELVIGTGLLSWAAGGTTVRHPLLTTPVDVRADAATGRIDVVVSPDATTRIWDRQLLEGRAGFEPGRAEVVRTELRSAEAHPLADENKELLARWRELALARARPYDHTWEPAAATPAADLRFAPVLVLRRRDRTSLIDYFDQMLRALSGPDAVAPLGLAQLLLALEPEDRLAWLESEGGTSGATIGDDPLFPLPANPEQRQIVERLTGDNGVVVQGPPGTGKTHTIANLVSALLAKGQRVLVTSQKAQALRVLRQKLPPPIQKLCVSLTDLGRGGSDELDESVTALSDRYSSFSPVAHEERVRDLVSARDAARQQVAELREAVRALRESETYVHPPVAAGYEGTKARIAERLTGEAGSCDWVPVPFPEEAPFDPPLSIGEMVELRRLTASGSAERRARTHQVLPDTATLPTGVAVRELVETEVAAAESARAASSEVSTALSAVDREQLAALRELVQDVATVLHQLGLGGEPERWPAHWYVQALVDGFAGRDMSIWQGLGRLAGHARSARDALAGIGLREVTLPAFDASGPDSLAGQIEAGRALRTHLAAGNTVKRRLRPAVQKRAERLLDGAAVNGVPVSTVELLDVVLARMEADQTGRVLVERWAAAGVQVERSQTLEQGVSQLVDLASTLDGVLLAVGRRAQAESALASLRVLIPLRSPQDWLAFTRSLDAVQARHDAEQATADLEEQAARLGLDGSLPTAPPELAAMARALAARDVEGYDAALQRLVGAFAEQEDQRRGDDLAARLHAAHPVLVDLVARTAADDDWDERLATFPDAWAWGRARTFFDAQRQAGLEERLAAKLDDAVQRVGRTTADLAAERAWGECLTRMTAHQEQALRSYRANMASRGAGQGRWAGRYAAGAREAMVEARGAVPAWIMPLREVVETIPPDKGSFDVVIVDEASQAGIDALFLLWLAPRVIVVGDERQCAPSQVHWGELQPIFDRLDDYLADVPEYLRLAFTPKSDLFSLLSTRFGSVIRLREHFRCMPEIVGWSSRMFYRDAPLVPLRQFGADRLAPLAAVHVPAAFVEGSGTRFHNRVEAQAVVDRIKACIADPAYDGRTFGVVVLQGRGQVQLIDDLLQSQVSQVDREQRRLRVGGPPDFQGDERHVMFVSMVIADRHRAVTSREWQRRFNVAASRAQEQMWLFHSVTADLLSPKDLRRSLLSYVLDPPATLDLPAFTGLGWGSERRDPFDSVFEQRAYLALRDRGYSVIPQVEVNGRRIDLVVVGSQGRLAVECDGDRWHSSPEAQLADVDRQLELERAGWTFWRVRESEFYLDPDAALTPLLTLLDQRGIHPGDLTPTTPAAPPANAPWEPIELSTDDTPDPQDAADLDLDLRPVPS